MYYWIGPFSTSVIWLYKLTDRNDIKIQNLDDVKNYLVGDTRDNATLPLLKSLGIKVDTAPSDLSSCRKFKIGRVDLVPIDQNAVQSFMSACDIAVDKVEKTIQLRRDSFLYIAVGKNTPPGIVTRLNNAFDLVRRDGTLKNINTKWGRQMSELQSLQ